MGICHGYISGSEKGLERREPGEERTGNCQGNGSREDNKKGGKSPTSYKGLRCRGRRDSLGASMGFSSVGVNRELDALSGGWGAVCCSRILPLLHFTINSVIWEELWWEE